MYQTLKTIFVGLFSNNNNSKPEEETSMSSSIKNKTNIGSPPGLVKQAHPFTFDSFCKLESEKTPITLVEKESSKKCDALSDKSTQSEYPELMVKKDSGLEDILSNEEEELYADSVFHANDPNSSQGGDFTPLLSDFNADETLSHPTLSSDESEVEEDDSLFTALKALEPMPSLQEFQSSIRHLYYYPPPLLLAQFPTPLQVFPDFLEREDGLFYCPQPRQPGGSLFKQMQLRRARQSALACLLSATFSEEGHADLLENRNKHGRGYHRHDEYDLVTTNGTWNERDNEFGRSLSSKNSLYKPEGSTDALRLRYCDSIDKEGQGDISIGAIKKSKSSRASI